MEGKVLAGASRMGGGCWWGGWRDEEDRDLRSHQNLRKATIKVTGQIPETVKGGARWGKKTHLSGRTKEASCQERPIEKKRREPTPNLRYWPL